MSNELKIPNCVGIIMDGNRRWAESKGKPRIEGHRSGGEKLKEVTKWVKEAGINHLVLYTFSNENWNRSPEEVSYMRDLMGKYLTEELSHFNKEGGILRCIGDLSRFPADLQEKLKHVEKETAGNPGPHIYLALSYGGRQEIIHAVKEIVKENPKVEDVTEEYFAKHLQTYPMPDPDIIIRTSGEMRLSGFLPWQGVYSELFFVKTLWPDFSKEEFVKIIEEYGNRDRRIGK
ncbi:MAG: polyprenyl diphosphate synthase [Candidatus Paceibacterota bacterium]|jgi:undecaprenyl diphosphate synthase